MNAAKWPDSFPNDTAIVVELTQGFFYSRRTFYLTELHTRIKRPAREGDARI